MRKFWSDTFDHQLTNCVKIPSVHFDLDFFKNPNLDFEIV